MVRSFMFCFLGVSLIGLTLQATNITASAYLNGTNVTIVYGLQDPNSVVSANYIPSLNEIGWDKLYIRTNQRNQFNDSLLAYTAGYLEGYLTYKRINSHFKNMNNFTWEKTNNTMPQNVKDFFTEQHAFIESQYNRNKSDHYWSMVYNIQRQFDGMVAGYNVQARVNGLNQINSIDFHTMTSFGDLFDIIFYKNKAARPNFNKMTYPQLLQHVHANNHCSALIKIAPDFTDLWFGHNSWFTYSAMTRIFKEYNFKFSNPLQKSNIITFSSYAGTISSNDDFYVTDADLVVIETTNSFFNTDLYDLLTSKSVMTWQRAMVSNFLSADSKTWTDIFSKNNSGTYNDQFMVLDLKMVDTEKQKLHENALWIIEQVPGFTKAGDVTNVLRYGYWPSFNTPYFSEIKNLSKIEQIIDQEPRMVHTLDYDVCARSEIFRRDQGKVFDSSNFASLMRYNNYLKDPLSLNNPGYVISARLELDSVSGMCGGAYDCKFASIHDVKGKKNKRIMINGSPTYDNLPAFNWNNAPTCRNAPREGLNLTSNYQWVAFESSSYDYSNEKKLKFLEK